MRGNLYRKQRIYHIRNALLSRLRDPQSTSPTIPSRFPLFSLFSYLGGCKINRWYSPHLDFHFFHIWESVKLLDVIPPTSSKNILNIYKYCISPTIVTVVQTTLLILCYLTDSLCIPSKTSAKCLAFKASAP